MAVEPAVATFPDSVFRIARTEGLLTPSRISPADAALPNAGNRFDVPGGGVVYAATNVETCYTEVLARFRPSPAMRTLLKVEDPGFILLGGVPHDWRIKRSIVELTADGPLPFLDIDHPDTMAFLAAELSDELVALGYGKDLDLSAVCNQDRMLSRRIANYAYTANDDDGYLYGGIKYRSRLDPAGDCWAIFDGTFIEQGRLEPIAIHDPALKRVSARFDITVH